MNENGREERKRSAAHNSGGELRENGNGDHLAQLDGIVVERVGDELYYRSAESQIEEREVLGDRPCQAEQAESRGSEVSRRHRHDEERQRQRNREPKEIEKCVVRDAGTGETAFTHRRNLDQARFPGFRKERRVDLDGEVVLEWLGPVLADPLHHGSQALSQRDLGLVAKKFPCLVR